MDITKFTVFDHKMTACYCFHNISKDQPNVDKSSPNFIHQPSGIFSQPNLIKSFTIHSNFTRLIHLLTHCKLTKEVPTILCNSIHLYPASTVSLKDVKCIYFVFLYFCGVILNSDNCFSSPRVKLSFFWGLNSWQGCLCMCCFFYHWWCENNSVAVSVKCK